MNSGDDRRRKYWVEQMEAAYGLMEAVIRCPVKECGESVQSLPDAMHAAGVEVLFSQSPIADDLPRKFLLRSGLVDRVVRAARELNSLGMVLKVEDGYRNRDMQRRLALRPGVFDKVLERIVWETGGTRPAEELVRRRLSVLVASCPKIGTHMSASAMDISVLDRDTGAEIDRGGPYLEMSERTPMESPFVSAKAAENRRTITTIMRKHGFVEYPYEFWHYSAGDAIACCMGRGRPPAGYGAVDIDESDGSVVAIPDPLQTLNAPEVISARMKDALRSVVGRIEGRG